MGGAGYLKGKPGEGDYLILKKKKKRLLGLKHLEICFIHQEVLA